MDSEDDIYAGLQALAETTFPKRCRTCGREYANLQAFIAQTEVIRPRQSGLKESEDDDGRPIVELFRNCVCGSTLMENLNNRRDLSEAGLQRRRRFDDMLVRLMMNGHEHDVAHAALMSYLHGDQGVLAALLGPRGGPGG